MEFNELLSGLLIIKEFDPDTELMAEHDQIWCGDAEKASEDQKQRLEELNWFISEDAFSHWT
jgi:hypothetical protein